MVLGEMIDHCCAEEKALRAVLTACPAPLAIAFSGGVDSRTLAFCALRAGLDVVAVHAFGPHIPEAETAYAEDFARKIGLPLLKMEFDPLALPGVADNGERRCYFCKKALISEIRAATSSRILCDGSNADDLHVYRPGMVALREEGVRSPLAEAGLGKAAIRRVAELAGMENPQQASRPCLLTRLAYGMKPDAEILRRLAETESALQHALGIDNFRLRLAPDPLLQCPPLAPEQKNMAVGILAARGFAGAVILDDGQISGFFDQK